MYSPIRTSLSKMEQRKQIKEQKKKQLVVLLVNKFRHKFGLITKPDNDVDSIIKTEVEGMLCDGNLKEADLNSLDKRLEVLIQK